MRDQSLSLRILVLAVLLPLTAAVCVGALVVTGALHPRVVHMVAAGWAILVVAVLAAAISALGPKYRPTPLLTPLFAGVFAALLATTAVYAVRAHVAPKRATVAAVHTKTVVPAPVIDRTAVAPAFAVMPQKPALEPRLDTGAAAPPAKAQDQIAADVQPLPADPADRAAMGGPLVDMASAVVPAAHAAEKPVGGVAHKPPIAVARIPAPAVAPAVGPKPNRDEPVNLTARFDPSGPTEPTAEGPPMVLDAADAAPTRHGAIPPLPRIRPCGVAGPACP